jgi:hypothetical protein
MQSLLLCLAGEIRIQSRLLASELRAACSSAYASDRVHVALGCMRAHHNSQ